MNKLELILSMFHWHFQTWMRKIITIQYDRLVHTLRILRNRVKREAGTPGTIGNLRKLGARTEVRT